MREKEKVVLIEGFWLYLSVLFYLLGEHINKRHSRKRVSYHHEDSFKCFN